QGPKQAMAAKAVQDQMNPFRGDPAGALASVEPGTGRIVALYGGKSFKKSQVDLATAKGGSGFQPGSTMKMFFVVAALEKGSSPGLTMAGPARITIPDRRCYTGNGPWSPGNAGDSSAGVYNMYGATAGSVNTWFAQLAVKVGPERALEVARKMGITTVPPRGSKAYASWNVCSLVLGVKEVSPLDMAGAFGVLANRGVRCAPYSITKVVAPGERKPLIENKPDCKRVIDEKISTRTVAMLRGVITGGTGTRASLGARPVAGKTGSAQDNLSAFFSGFTPQLSTSVWVGFRARRVPMRTQFQGRPVYGGTFPAIIFHDYMQAALAGQPIVGFPAAPPPPAPPSLGVPDVVGLSQGEAESVLARAGFRSSVRQVPSDQPRGRVVRQGPRAGTKLRQGGTVYLAVSGGRGRGGNGVVPGVVGLQVSVARALLTRAGFRSGLAYTNSGKPGRVAAQSPAAGARLPKGSYITLVVSRRS
ncbi:MAG TPA: PASTA domain-containing protein, partial [Actinomycetota bacterium]|nr:PASTA domain-containing protein [Actinomycetota bacterium]